MREVDVPAFLGPIQRTQIGAAFGIITALPSARLRLPSGSMGWDERVRRWIATDEDWDDCVVIGSLGDIKDIPYYVKTLTYFMILVQTADFVHIQPEEIGDGISRVFDSCTNPDTMWIVKGLLPWSEVHINQGETFMMAPLGKTLELEQGEFQHRLVQHWRTSKSPKWHGQHRSAIQSTVDLFKREPQSGEARYTLLKISQDPAVCREDRILACSTLAASNDTYSGSRKEWDQIKTTVRSLEIPAEDSNHKNWNRAIQLVEDGHLRFILDSKIVANNDEFLDLTAGIRSSRSGHSSLRTECLDLASTFTQEDEDRITSLVSAVVSTLSHGGMGKFHDKALSFLLTLSRDLEEWKEPWGDLVPAILDLLSSLGKGSKRIISRTTSKIRKILLVLLLLPSSPMAGLLLEALKIRGDSVRNWSYSTRRTLSDFVQILKKGEWFSEEQWGSIYRMLLGVRPGEDTSAWESNHHSWAPLVDKPLQDRIRFAAWNSNGFQSSWRNGEFKRMINIIRPDVLHLSETKTSVPDLIERIGDEVREYMTSRGYYCYWYWNAKSPSIWGTALFTRIKPLSVEYGFGGEHPLDTEGRHILADFGKFQVAGNYSPCTEWDCADEMPRRVQYEQARISRLAGIENLVCMGDDNCAQTSLDYDAGITSPHLHPSAKPYEQLLFQKLLHSNGLVDVYRSFNPVPSANDFSWSRTPQDRHDGKGMRIDHLLASSSLLNNDKEKPSFVACKITKTAFRSDHRVMVGEFDLRSNPDWLSGVPEPDMGHNSKVQDTACFTQASDKPSNVVYEFKIPEAFEIPGFSAKSDNFWFDRKDYDSPSTTSFWDIEDPIHIGTLSEPGTPEEKDQPTEDTTTQPTLIYNNNGSWVGKQETDTYFKGSSGGSNRQWADVCGSSVFLDSFMDMHDHVHEYQWAGSMDRPEFPLPWGDGRECIEENICSTESPKSWMFTENPIIPVLFNNRTKGSSLPKVNDHADERMENDSEIQEEEYAFSDSLTSSSCMPFLKLGMGGSANSGPSIMDAKVLADTGALPNCITQSAARRAGAKRIFRHEKSLPLFTMMDGTRSRPLGVCQVSVWFSETRVAKVEAYIVPPSDFDLVIGSGEFSRRNANLDYERCQMSLRVVEDIVTIPFSMTEREVVPVALYSKREIIIPAKGKVVVDVFSPNRKGTVDETDQYRKWGLITGSGNQGFLVQTTSQQRRSGSEQIRIFNYGGVPVKISRAQRLAFFTPEDPEYYHQIRMSGLEGDKLWTTDLSVPLSFPADSNEHFLSDQEQDFFTSGQPEIPVLPVLPVHPVHPEHQEHPEFPKIARRRIKETNQTPGDQPPSDHLMSFHDVRTDGDMETRAASVFKQSAVRRPCGVDPRNQYSGEGRPPKTCGDRVTSCQSPRHVLNPGEEITHTTGAQKQHRLEQSGCIESAQQHIHQSPRVSEISAPSNPRRLRQPDCSSYLQDGKCKFESAGKECRFAHRDSFPFEEVRDIVALHVSKSLAGKKCHRSRFSLCHKLGLHGSAGAVHSRSLDELLAALNEVALIDSVSVPTRFFSQHGKLHPENPEAKEPVISPGLRSQIEKVSVDTDNSLEPWQKKEITDIIEQFADIWGHPSVNDKCAKLGISCKLKLNQPANFVARTRPLHPTKRAVLTQMITEQLKKGIIAPSKSATTSSVLLVPKPGGKWRFCVDYTSLNKITESDAYSVPRTDEYFAAMGGNKYFSTFDLVDAFWSLPLHEESQELTAFLAPDGVYQYLRMPQGIKQGPANFSRFIDEVFRDLKWDVCVTYIDDIVVFTKTYEEHVEALTQIFSRIRQYGLFFKPEKCKIFTKELKFLGHIISETGVAVDPDKIKAVTEMKRPETVKELKSALGFLSYFRKYIPGFSRLASPLLQELKGTKAKLKSQSRAKILWPDSHQSAWEMLTAALVAAPILAHPDWLSQFEVHCDACMHGLGAALMQKDSMNNNTVVMFASKSLTDTETRYSVWEMEALCCVWAVTGVFQQYLRPPFGGQFKLFTDNVAVSKSLTLTKRKKISTPDSAIGL